MKTSHNRLNYLYESWLEDGGLDQPTLNDMTIRELIDFRSMFNSDCDIKENILYTTTREFNSRTNIPEEDRLEVLLSGIEYLDD